MECINSFEELKRIKRRGEYRLGCDIDCGGETVKCILGDFSGKLYGDGHTLSNLILSDEIWGDEQFLALFYSTTRAEIQDIIFDDITLKYDRTCYHARIAALVGNCANSIVKNVVVNMNSSDDRIPLIYEANDCTIEKVAFKINGTVGALTKYNNGEEM